MEETSKNYYHRNKSKYQKGGKYYNYVPIHQRNIIPIKVKKGKFIIYFN